MGNTGDGLNELTDWAREKLTLGFLGMRDDNPTFEPYDSIYHALLAEHEAVREMFGKLRVTSENYHGELTRSANEVDRLLREARGDCDE